MEPLEQYRSEIDSIDREMADLFFRRMETVSRIAAYKQEHDIPVSDSSREAEILARGAERVPRPELLPFYALFQQKTMDLSRDYQQLLIRPGSEFLPGVLGYEVCLERDCLSKARQYLELDRNVMIVTDDGVPARYVDTLARQCLRCTVHCVPAGENSKSLSSVQALLQHMMDFGLTRRDCIAAVGGGMVGDLAGLAASVYMRGIDFYNVPTTLLAQADASIGGKTAVDFGGIKNLIGTFYRPRAVLSDPAVLETLPRRQMAAGLAEIVKIAMTSDGKLFQRLETCELFPPPDDVIRRAVANKAAIVSADEREHGLRRVLNFGHTIGHAIEAVRPDLLHGECVALGMLPMCDEPAAGRLRSVLLKLGLPVSCEPDREQILRFIRHDKKADDSAVIVTRVHEPGNFYFSRVSPELLVQKLDLISEGGTDL